MSRSKKPVPFIGPLFARSGAVKAVPPPCRLRGPERLEDRTLPAVTLIPDGSGRFVVQFTEDLPSTSDTLLLRVNTGGLLEYGLNASPFTIDLDSTVAGVQSRAVSAISRIDVLLDGGDDVLGVDGLTNPAVIPAPSGIVFAAGAGADRLDYSGDQNMTLTGSALTVGGRNITFTDLETARLTGGNGDTVLDAAAFTGPLTLDGGNGKDTLIGGSGDDILLGVAGGDSLDGRGGNDQLFSGNSGTTMIGGLGNDSLNGGNGPDQMDGGDGNDLLSGGNGTDLIDGGTGNDTFIGGIGNDTALGGPGIDLVIGAGDMNWTLTNGTLTGEGTDILQSIEQGQLSGGGKDNTLNAAGFSGRVTLQGGGGNDTLIGGTGQNVFNRPVGELGNITMTGGPAGSINDYFLWLQGALRLTSPGGYDRLNFLAAVTLDLNMTDGTPQAVDAAGSTVALNGFFEECLGSAFDDMVIAASNTIVEGGSGKDTLISNGKSNVQLSGGADADSLQQTGGINIVLSGDDGLDALIGDGGTNITMDGGKETDVLVESGGKNVTMRGGADADSLQQTGGTNIIMFGDDGLDNLTSNGGIDITMDGGKDVDVLVESDGKNVTMRGGADADTLQSSGGTNILMTGGSDADTLQQQNGTNITLAGDEGLDHLVSLNGTQVTMSGGADADTLQQSAGATIVLAGDDGLDLLTSLNGSQVTMTGGADADTLIQQGGTSINMSGDSGFDSLTSQNGNSVTMSGGADADSLLQSGGTDINLSGDDGLDTLTSDKGIDIFMTGGTGPDALLESGGKNVTMRGGADSDSLVSSGSTEITLTGDEGDDQITVKDSVDDSIDGGTGNDTFVLAGSSLGTIVIDEVAGPNPDLSRDTLDFSAFIGGPININLAVTTPQTVTPGQLTMTLTDAAGIENVIGTAFADTILGNARDNLLLGADPLNPPTGVAPGWDGVTQVVFLDFDTYTEAGEHPYTAGERAAIQVRLEGDYIGPDPAHPWFHFQFTQTQPAAGPYARLNFNQTPIVPEQETGGFAYELDFRNLNLGTDADPSFASVQVNGILGAPGQPPDTSDHWVALSAKIGAHELGHLVGLLHTDAFGPIGYGPHTPPGGVRYNPDFTGTAAAFETFDHLMSSPASVGSDRFNDLRDLYFGEREAVKLTFAESGTVVPEAPAPHRSFATAQPIVLAPLAVPNTLSGGLNAHKSFTVGALDVVGDIGIDPGTGLSESDFYSFTGRAGDLVNIEVLSQTLTRLGTNIIDPIIRVYDAGHNLVAHYIAPAVNDDGPESTDATILDLTLPADGTYYVEVDTFAPAAGSDTDVGAYELFAYRFDAGNADDVGDVLNGQGGNDTVTGGLGNDVLTGGFGNDSLKGGTGDDTYLDPAAGADTVADESGRDTLDFSATPQGVTVSIGLDAGQTQTLTAGGDSLAISGTLEVVFGTAFADSLTGNAADNVLMGGAGPDTVRAGLGNDVVIGDDGNDTLDGDDGRDLVIGGLGSDVVRGLGGDDILIGGRTTYDSNLSALNNIMAEWTGTGSYAQRVAHLTGQPGGLNGTTYLIKGTSVLDDNKAGDTLTGGLGLDLFFGFVGDKVTDRDAPDEISL
jgi:Ca2+-binding RTX toxin-like protein